MNCYLCNHWHVYENRCIIGRSPKTCDQEDINRARESVVKESIAIGRRGLRK